MATSVYISPRRVQIVIGQYRKKRLQIQRVFQEALPAGTVINGVIVNEAAITRALTNLAKIANLKKQLIDLTVDSSSVLVRSLRVPPLAAPKLLALAKEEFSEVKDNYDELIYDYGVIGRRNADGRGGTILCTAVEKRFIAAYIEIFHKLNLRLNSIDIAISSTIKMVAAIPQIRDKTFVIALLEANTLVSVLFVKGKFYALHRSRLLAERGSDQSIDEVGRIISSIIQFSLREEIDENIRGVYFCGAEPREDNLISALSHLYNIEIGKMPNFPVIETTKDMDYLLADYFYVSGNLLLKDGLNND